MSDIDMFGDPVPPEPSPTKSIDKVAGPKSRDRLSNGYFAKGNKIGINGGSGNPFMLEVHRLKRELYKNTKQSDMKEVWLKIIEQAKEGSPTHQKIFLDYAVGAPKQVIEATIEQLNPTEVQARIDLIFGINTPSQDPLTDLNIEVNPQDPVQQ